MLLLEVMAHFYFETEVSNLLRLDAPLTKGPVARWQRKALEASNTSTTSLNSTALNNTAGQQSFSKSPSKGNLNKSSSFASSPSKRSPKTPGKSKNNTPSRAKTPKTPVGADRFIPNRAATQFDLAHYKVTQTDKENSTKVDYEQQEYQRVMSENLNGGDISKTRIIHYNNRPPVASDGAQNNLRVLYSHSKAPSSLKKCSRHIPQAPDRVLDAPEMMDDYYLNLVDWSINNHLAIALGNTVYIWNANNGEIQQLVQQTELDFYISSVSWIAEGTHLAIGTSQGAVELWDLSVQKRMRKMTGHSARVGSLSWNSYVLSSGSRSSQIHHHDVRVGQHNVGILAGHSQEVCGLKWSPDGRYLASGANDNLVNIWAAASGQRFTETSPLFTFNQHQAAVKALAWCPWQPHVLASGGGTADRCVRFWNCNTGTSIHTAVDANSQVCAILWSTEYKEFISGHGFANNQLIIWKYPTMQRVAELSGHTARVLHMALSPDGTTVASVAADETLRLWKCFDVDRQSKKQAAKIPIGTKSVLKNCIR